MSADIAQVYQTQAKAPGEEKVDRLRRSRTLATAYSLMIVPHILSFRLSLHGQIA
jgi:hypothetical protein